MASAIAEDGAIWAVWTKGQKALTETHVRDAAKAQGLVDVKVMSFSPELSALKLVIPVALRAKKASGDEKPQGGQSGKRIDSHRLTQTNGRATGVTGREAADRAEKRAVYFASRSGSLTGL